MTEDKWGIAEKTSYPAKENSVTTSKLNTMKDTFIFVSTTIRMIIATTINASSLNIGIGTAEPFKANSGSPRHNRYREHQRHIWWGWYQEYYCKETAPLRVFINPRRC